MDKELHQTIKTMDKEIMTIKNRRVVAATLKYMLDHGELEWRRGVFGAWIAHSKTGNCPKP